MTAYPVRRRCRAKRCGNVAAEGNSYCGACLETRRPASKPRLRDDRNPSQLTPTARPEFVGGNSTQDWKLLPTTGGGTGHERWDADWPASDTPGISSR